ncbi:MAG: cytochrome b5-like heme/steroid binding domain-containing protein [Candidatus Paceibacterota bacterium]|jgi:cytochrome b involved in lipid metabolism
MTCFKKTIGFLALAIFVIGSLVIVIKSEATKPNLDAFGSGMGTGGATRTVSDGSGAISAGGYTLAEVARHNSGASCWVAIAGGVYDVTSFIERHPGGSDAILSLCGVDGSSAFDNQHGGQSKPAEELVSFKIGVLKN